MLPNENIQRFPLVFLYIILQTTSLGGCRESHKAGAETTDTKAWGTSLSLIPFLRCGHEPWK